MDNKYFKIICLVVLIVMCLFAIPLLFNCMLPFVIAVLIATSFRKLVSLFDEKLRIPRSVVSFVIVLAILAILAGLVVLIVSKIMVELNNFIANFSTIADEISNQINGIKIWHSALRESVVPEVADFLDGVFDSVQASIAGMVPRITSTTTLFAAVAFPQTVFFSIVTVMSTYFFTKDYEKIVKFCVANLPGSFTKFFLRLKNSVLHTFLQYFKAQLILMSITFVEVTIFLFMIGVNYAALIGFVVGMIDFIPALGPGLLLIPWAVLCVIKSNYARALYFIILQLMCFLTRQLLEPKVLGKQIGLHPLAILMSAYLGLKVLSLCGFGFFGIIVGPIITVVLFSFYSSNHEDVD